ncbi:MAG: energy transducer TonB [Bacteroidota bacterium]
MKYFISIFLLLIIACKSKTDQRVSDNKPLDNMIFQTNLDMTDTTCIIGIQKARKDLENKLYKKISYGIVGFSDEYIEVMKKDYNIEVENIGCVVDGSEDCYNSIMDSAIIVKFGRDLFLIAQKKADSIAIKNSKLPSLQTLQRVDEEPKFIGGEQQLMNFLTQNTNYPKSAIQNKIQGQVFVQFTIDNLGNVNEVSILKGLSSDLDKESLRVIKLMPKWEPAKLNGKNVSYTMRIPLRFKLDNK